MQIPFFLPLKLVRAIEDIIQIFRFAINVSFGFFKRNFNEQESKIVPEFRKSFNLALPERRFSTFSNIIHNSLSRFHARKTFPIKLSSFSPRKTHKMPKLHSHLTITFQTKLFNHRKTRDGEKINSSQETPLARILTRYVN